MDGTEWIQLPIAQGGIATILVGVVIAIFTGRLLPRWWVDQLRKADTEAIERLSKESAEWRKAYKTESAANRELVGHVHELMETGRLAEHLFRSAAGKASGDT